MTATLSNRFCRGFLLDGSIKGFLASTYNTRVKVLKEITWYEPGSFLKDIAKRVGILALGVLGTVVLALATIVTLGLKKGVRDMFIAVTAFTAGAGIGFVYDIISFVGEEFCGVLGLFSPSVYIKFLEKRGEFEEKVELLTVDPENMKKHQKQQEVVHKIQRKLKECNGDKQVFLESVKSAAKKSESPVIPDVMPVDEVDEKSKMKTYFSDLQQELSENFSKVMAAQKPSYRQKF